MKGGLAKENAMRRIVMVAWGLLLLLAPLGVAQGSGELVSASPIELFGSVRAETKGLTLFHGAYENATFSGTIYNGTVVERQRHIQPNCGGLNYEEEHIRLSVGSGDLRFITFEARRGAIVTATLAPSVVDLHQSAGVGSKPVAYLGPNPYRYGEFEESPPSGYYSGQEARAFPMEQFLVVPQGTFFATGGGRIVIEMGSLTAHQGGAAATYSSDAVTEQRECPSGTFPPFPGSSTRTIVKTIIIYYTSGAFEARQSAVDQTLDYWRGERGLGKPDEGKYPTPSAGNWRRTDTEGVIAAYREYALPATSLAGEAGLGIPVDGRVSFRQATGTISDRESRTIAEPSDLDLSGSFKLFPVHDEDAGRRMSTRLDGSLYDVDVGAGSQPDWKAFGMGAVGGGLLLGVALYGWPGLRWKATQLFFFPLYARLRKEEVLENPLRDDILQVVQDQPGISASELGRRLDCGWGTLVYHLTVLERMQLVSSAREGRHKRFFAQGRINYSDKGAVGLLANPAARTILDAVRSTPGVIQKDLSERLGLAAGTIAWHVERLEAEGLVVREEDGRSVRYFPSDRLLKLTERLAA